MQKTGRVWGASNRYVAVFTALGRSPSAYAEALTGVFELIVIGAVYLLELSSGIEPSVV
jgi:hypothetical protein